MTDFAPPIAFHFSVTMSGNDAPALAFQEVSGLEVPTVAEAVEGGQKNRFTHQLPVGTGRKNLKLTGGTIEMNAPLVAWARRVLEGGMSDKIEPRDLTITLIGEQGAPMARWLVSKAYPVSWNFAGIDATANMVTIEKLEFAFQTVTREV